MAVSEKSYYSFVIERNDIRLEAIFRQKETGCFEFLLNSPRDEPGILYRISSALYANDWDIINADLTVDADGRITNRFSICFADRNTMPDPDDVNTVMGDLERLLLGGISVVEFLNQKKLQISVVKSDDGFADLTYENGLVVIEIKARKLKWTLPAVFQAFYLMDVNVKEAKIETLPDFRMENRFIVATEDSRYHNPEFRKRLMEELVAVL